MWLLPTNDPDGLHRFFMWCRDSGLNSPGLVLIETSEYEAKKEGYDSVIVPPSWRFTKTSSSDYVSQIKEVWHLYKDAPWVGLMGDDCIPLSINWEKGMLDSLTGWNIVSVHDDRKTGSGGISRSSIWSGDVFRAAGCLFFNELTEAEQYQAWIEVALATGCNTHRGDLVVRKVGYQSPDISSSDAMQQWKADRLPGLVASIENMKTARGILKYEVDYTGVSLMVAVPTVDGTLGYEFLGCLHETFAMLAQLGVPHEFIVEPFNADIVMVRSKLFAKFMRSTSTHLLMIDSDMGWNVQAIGRLFAAKKDFVAVAGPKKKTPLQCAVTPLPLDKNYGSVSFDATTGTVEVLEVGGAFNLFTRKFGEDMIAAYPELTYVGIGGNEEHSFFMPMILGKAYKAEDYAICHRWRSIGGKVFVCPDVSLKHIGRHVYEGPWTETWPKPQELKVAAE